MSAAAGLAARRMKKQKEKKRLEWEEKERKRLGLGPNEKLPGMSLTLWITTFSLGLRVTPRVTPRVIIWNFFHSHC